MRKNWSLWAFSILAGLLYLLWRRTHTINDWTLDQDSQIRAAHAQLEGKPMPPLDVTGWLNGQISPADMKGKVILFDFFATWCPPCMRTIPENNELFQKYQTDGLLVVGICTSNSGQERLNEIIASKGIKYPVARDPSLAAQTTWRVRYYPTYTIVDRAGTVRAVGINPSHLEEWIQKLLAEKPPT